MPIEKCYTLETLTERERIAGLKAIKYRQIMASHPPQCAICAHCKTKPAARIWSDGLLSPTALCALCRTKLEEKFNHIPSPPPPNGTNCGSFDIRGSEWLIHNSKHWCAPCTSRHFHNPIKTTLAEKDIYCEDCMLCNKKLPSAYQEPSRRYGRRNLRLCNICSKYQV